MNQYIQNIELIPTKFPYVFNVSLKLDHQTRYIGKLDKASEGTFSAKRTEKHLHRKTNSLGINLELLQRFNFKWIVISFCGNKLVTSRNYFLQYGKVFNFEKSGYEKQCFLTLDLWSEDKAQLFECSLSQQGNLFNEAA